MCQQYKSIKKTLWEKEKLLVKSNFSFFQCFLLIWRTFCYFHQIWNCHLQTLSVWKCLKFVIWERLKVLSANSINSEKAKIFMAFYGLVNGLTLSQRTNFKLFETERLWRRQFKIWWKWQKVFPMGRKHCGKRRNCSLQAISSFPTVFSKDFYCRHVKTRACLGKG